jgi:serine/threonine protein kinase
MESSSVNHEGGTSAKSYASQSIIAEHYRVERILGRGGMATVYCCTDLRTNEEVAVKVLHPELGSAVVIERFLREISFASELDHPQIPKVLGSGVTDGIPYYVMTYVNGESLRRLIDREKQLPLQQALRIACEIIKPTAYAHKRGIVHRDLKPENILVSESGVYVLDFGISRAIIESGGDRLTATGVGVGTPAYMSPEQALGDRGLDARTDIYSLGCVIYEMIGGMPPFVGPTPQVVISRRFAGTPPPLRELRDGVPEEVEYAVERALAKSPSDRWASADDFGAALTACATGELRFTGTMTLAMRRRHRRTTIATLVAGVLAASAFAWSAAYREPFASAQRSIASWNFDQAAKELERAVLHRPDDARSHLWLAQVMMLKDPSPTAEPDAWKQSALFAHDHRASLTPAERMRADGLAAFAAEDVPRACDSFRELAKTEQAAHPDDFASSLSYADCILRDKNVVPASSSPSGFGFRTSFRYVDSLYEALLDRHSNNPASFAALMPRIQRVLVIDKATLRLGILPGPTQRVFLSYPTLIDDTLAYIPYGVSATEGMFRARDQRGLTNALFSNRRQLKSLALKWVAVGPDDPAAHETLAKILEATGELSGTEPSALQQIAIARNLEARDKESGPKKYIRQIRAVNYHVRLYLRSLKFDEAAALADSALSWRVPQLSHQEEDEAGGFAAGLAAVRGQPSRVRGIQRAAAADYQVFLPNGQRVTLPVALGIDAIAIREYAAYGGSADSMIAITSRLLNNINTRVPPEDVDAWRRGILLQPLTLAAPVIGPEPVANLGPARDPRVNALASLAKGETNRARFLLDSLVKLRGGYAPSELSMDIVFLEAWLRTQLGDTATATRTLDDALNGLSGGEPGVLKDLDEDRAASLVRVMALRAELAAKGGQKDVAKKWADAVLLLWGNGDAIVKSTVDRMRALH